VKTGSAVLTAGLGVASRATGQISALVLVLVAARFLAPADFGVFSLAAAGITLIRSQLYAGAFEYLLKAADPDRVSNACLAINLAMSLVLSFLLVAGVAVASPLFGSPSLILVVAAMAPSTLIAAFSAWQESLFLRGKGVKPYYAITAATEIVSGAVGIGLLFANWGIWALVAQVYLRTLILLCAYLALQPPRFAGLVNGSTLSEVAEWSWPRYSALTLNFLSNYGADFILGALLSPRATGLYRAGNRIASSVSDLFAQPATLIGGTAYSRRAANGLQAEDVWPRILLAACFVGWPALAGLSVVAGDLTPILLGSAWTSAGPVIAVLCLARAAALISACISPYLVAYNQGRLVLTVQACMAMLTIAGLFVAARFGVEYASLWVAAVMIGANIGLVSLAQRLKAAPGGILLRNAFIVSVAVAATAMPAFLVLKVVPGDIVWRLPVAILAGLGGWGLTLALFRTPVIDAVRALDHR